MDMNAVINQFATTDYVIKKNTEDITHDESLMQPQPGGSSMNWIMGHINKSRAEMAKILGVESPFVPETFALYRGGAGHPFDPAKAVKFDDLMEQFAMMQKPIMDGLQSVTAEQLAAKAPFSPTGNPDETIGSLLAAFAFHEAYHAGQTGVLRRVAGKPGALEPPAEA